MELSAAGEEEDREVEMMHKQHVQVDDSSTAVVEFNSVGVAGAQNMLERK